MMKRSLVCLAALLAVVAGPSLSVAQAPPEPPDLSFSLQYSASGDTYGLLTYPVQQDLWGVRGLSADIAGGYRFRDSVPVYGLGFGYRFHLDRATFKTGLLVLFDQGQGVPSSGRADVAFGFGVSLTQRF